VTTVAPPQPGELTFTTKDGRTISESMIRSAMSKTSGSVRGAARELTIQDSTLRGWLNKLPDVDTRGPTAPTAAKVIQDSGCPDPRLQDDGRSRVHLGAGQAGHRR
jgi:hypothetical protein